MTRTLTHMHYHAVHFAMSLSYIAIKWTLGGHQYATSAYTFFCLLKNQLVGAEADECLTWETAYR